MELIEPFDLNQINSFVHTANKEDIVNTYYNYKDIWIEKAVLTYYAEDFIQYQNSQKIKDSLEIFILYIIYINIL